DNPNTLPHSLNWPFGMQHHEKIALLVRRRFPKFQEGLSRGVLGPELQAVKHYTAELESLPASELDARLIEEARNEAVEIEEAGRRNDETAFFSQPDAAADFRYWCALKSWTLEETTFVLVGKDPQKVSWKSLYNLR